MGGDISNFVRYIQSTVVYQEEAIGMQIQGKVIASFIVNKEGYVEQIRIIKGVDPLLDNEVVKALKASPRWKPGKQRDIPVKVIFTIPVVFKINY
jgi:protein TonB